MCSCITQARFLQELQAEFGGRVAIEKIDVELESQRARSYGVLTLPTTLIVDRMPTVGQANYGLADARTFAPLTAAALNGFLAQVQPGDYVALQAYVESTAETDAVLRMLRAQLRDYLKLATTVGYGPYLLHSTGRLHKSDAGQDVAIPKEADQ